jgi:hypothetical protein
MTAMTEWRWPVRRSNAEPRSTQTHQRQFRHTQNFSDIVINFRAFCQLAKCAFSSRLIGSTLTRPRLSLRAANMRTCAYESFATRAAFALSSGDAASHAALDAAQEGSPWMRSTARTGSKRHGPDPIPHSPNPIRTRPTELLDQHLEARSPQRPSANHAPSARMIQNPSCGWPFVTISVCSRACVRLKNSACT